MIGNHDQKQGDAMGAVAAGALLVLGIWWIPQKPARPPLLVAPVRRADIEESVLAGGTIQPLKLVSVGAQASGRMLSLHVALGDEVRKGHLIDRGDRFLERAPRSPTRRRRARKPSWSADLSDLRDRDIPSTQLICFSYPLIRPNRSDIRVCDSRTGDGRGEAMKPEA